MAEIKGFDISVHQGRVNWDLIQQAYDRGEIGFVILRAGYGGGGVDGQFARNWAEARRRGIPRQAYFFAYPGRSGGRAQAEEFKRIVGDLQNGESVSLDMEDEPTYGRRLVVSDVQWALDFLRRAEELFGVKPLIYMNSDVLHRFNWQAAVDGNYGLWLANYGPNNGQPNTRPSSGRWPFWALWQYTSRANLAGISPLDMNIFSGDKAAFLKYGYQGGNAAPAPKPTPVPAPSKPSSTYTVVKSIPGYVSSTDAAARRNSNSKVPAGTYSVFNVARGMVNVTRVPGAPGWWINPGDNAGAPAPAPSGEIYTVVKGDTVDRICSKYGISKANNYAAIRAMNPNLGHGGDWTNIWPGDKIRVR